MTACAHRLVDADGLLCDRPDPHTTGHTYTASWAADAPKDEEVNR